MGRCKCLILEEKGVVVLLVVVVVVQMDVWMKLIVVVVVVVVVKMGCVGVGVEQESLVDEGEGSKSRESRGWRDRYRAIGILLVNESVNDALFTRGGFKAEYFCAWRIGSFGDVCSSDSVLGMPRKTVRVLPTNHCKG